MTDMKIYGYMRVSSKEQNEDRQRIALIEMGVQEKNIYMDRSNGSIAFDCMFSGKRAYGGAGAG